MSSTTRNPTYSDWGGAPDDGRFVFRFEAIGTHWELETVAPLSHPLRQRIFARIEQFDRTYSRFRPDSLVATLAAASEGGRKEQARIQPAT